MHGPELRVEVPQLLADQLDDGALATLVAGIAAWAGAAVRLQPERQTAARDGCPPTGPDPAAPRALPIRHLNETVGRIHCPDDASAAVQRAGEQLAGLFQHLVQREAAVVDLAGALVECYAELNLLYNVMTDVASCTDQRQIARRIVDETARALHCGRVSLLLLDENAERFTLVASHGLPGALHDVTIPVRGSIAGRAVTGDDGVFVRDIVDAPELAGMSRGSYDSRAFAVIRVPLQARGRALGVLCVTERAGPAEFNARDRKLLEAISALGASALMNCRLHAAMERQVIGTIEALASAVDAKDHYTHHHSRRVAELCLAMARRLDLDGSISEREIELAALLHDAGKIGVPDAILAKTGPLSREEYEVVKSHARLGAEIIGRAEGMQRVADAILHHHERYDGAGYPDGLAGDAIPIAARLIAVADAFDCLTTDRPYHQGIGADAALAELQRSAGAHFDPTVVAAFAAALRSGDRAE
ncbi:MAG: HD-GYP domain-containing protein [Phycisphaerae bacterium]